MMKRIATPAKCAPREMMRHIEFYNRPYSTFELILVAGEELERVHLDPAFVCSASEYFAIRFAPGTEWKPDPDLRLDEIAPDAPKSTIAIASMLFRTFYTPQAMELNDRERAWDDAIILLRLCEMLQVSDQIKKLATECIRGIMRIGRDHNKIYLADLVAFVATGVWSRCVEPILFDIYQSVKCSESAASRGNEDDRRVLLASAMDAIPDELRSHYLMRIMKGASAMTATAVSVMISDAKNLHGEPLIACLSHLNALPRMRLLGSMGQERMRAWCNELDAIDRDLPVRAKFVDNMRLMLLNTALQRNMRPTQRPMAVLSASKRKRSLEPLADQYFDEVEDDDFDPLSALSDDESDDESGEEIEEI